MEKLKIFGISLFFILFLTNQGYAKIASQGIMQTDTLLRTIDLNKKSYYQDIFNKNERNELKKADKYIESAKKSMVDYYKNMAEIDKFYTIAEATGSSKSREKALSKARNLEQKSLKSGFKSLEEYKKGNRIKTKVYTSALNKIRLNDNSKHAQFGRELELQARLHYEKSGAIENAAPEHDSQLLFNSLDDANTNTIKALRYQENAFAAYKKDPDLNPDGFKVQDKLVVEKDLIVKDPDKVVVVDSVLFPVYVEQYNPLTDPNLYLSRSGMILPRLKLSKQDKDLLNEVNRKNQYANDLLKQVDEAYQIVDSLNYTADRTADFAARDKIRNAAIEKEQTAFYKLTNATNIYIDVNQTRYQIYQAYFPKIDEKKMTVETERAKKYEAEARDYFSRAQVEIANANKQMFRSEQYIQLMGANDMLLYALQLQESAYGIYLNMPEAIMAKTDTALVTKNKKNQGVSESEKEKNSQSSEWKVKSTYTYSAEKPKASAYKSKNGVVFVVQFGVFKGIIPAEKFGNVQPVIFDEFADNSNRRFMAGEYRTAEASEAALALVRKAGYPDAYIVSLVDGQRKSYTFGKENINPSADDYPGLVKTEMAKVSGGKIPIVENEKKEIGETVKMETVKDEPSKTGIVEENSIKKTKGLVYLVQLGLFAKPISYAEINNLQPVYTDIVPDKGTRYLLGTYSSLVKAREENQRVVEKGIADAYVVAYHNGSPITLEKAKELESKQDGTKENVSVPSGAIAFMVQLGAYREKLNTADETKLKTLFTPNDIEIKTIDGMNIYLTGNFKSYREADTLKKKLLADGHQGIFVVAFSGNKKIPVGDAIKMSNN